MIIRILVIFAVSIVISSCAVRTLHTKIYRTYSSDGVSIPKLGDVAAGEIGDNLYSEYIGNTTTTLKAVLENNAEGEVDIDGKFHKYNISAGTSTINLGEMRNNGTATACFNNVLNIATADIAFGSQKIWGKSIDDTVCLLDREPDMIFDTASLETKPRSSDESRNNITVSLNNGVSYKIIKDTERNYSMRSFERVILYQGISKGTIKISYREYSGGMARTAFTQDVQYELDRNGKALIAFKGARIEVIKADNTSIIYKVLEPFRDSIVR